jgi:environmental stress-induced protein Ves
VGAEPASLELLRAAQRAAVPWKNGGGLTREVAVYPPGSDLRGFDWRVSIADIHAAGPFSLFPGIERRMAVLTGRLELLIDGQPPLTLSPESPAVEFSGDVAVFAEPLGAAVTDLNVMTRRGRCNATLTRSATQESTVLAPRTATTLIIALSELVVRRAKAELMLSRLDALAIKPGAECTIAARSGAASFHVIEIF